MTKSNPSAKKDSNKLHLTRETVKSLHVRSGCQTGNLYELGNSVQSQGHGPGIGYCNH